MNCLSSVYLLLSYNLYRANIFSMPWKSVILLCKFESASNILSLNFESGEISLRFLFFNMKIFFLPITLSLGHLHHLSLSFSSSMLRNSSLLISSGCIFRILKNDCWHSLDHLFFISTYAGFEFHFQCYHFLFHHDIFIFIDKSIFWSDNFLRCHLSLSLKDSEEVQLCALLSVHELTDNQWPTGNGFWKIILVTDYEIHLFFVEWFMD